MSILHVTYVYESVKDALCLANLLYPREEQGCQQVDAVVTCYNAQRERKHHPPCEAGIAPCLHIIAKALNHDKLNKTGYKTKHEHTLLWPFCFRPLQAAIRQYQIQVLNYNVNRRCGLRSNRLDYRQSDKCKQETRLNLNHSQEYSSTIYC